MMHGKKNDACKKKNDWIQCTNRGVGFTWTTYTTVEEKQIVINDKLVDVIRIW